MIRSHYAKQVKMPVLAPKLGLTFAAREGSSFTANDSVVKSSRSNDEAGPVWICLLCASEPAEAMLMLFLDVLMTFKPVMKMFIHRMTFLPAVIVLQAIVMFLSSVMIFVYAVMTFKHKFDTMPFVGIMMFLFNVSVLLLSQKFKLAL